MHKLGWGVCGLWGAVPTYTLDQTGLTCSTNFWRTCLLCLSVCVCASVCLSVRLGQSNSTSVLHSGRTRLVEREREREREAPFAFFLSRWLVHKREATSQHLLTQKREKQSCPKHTKILGGSSKNGRTTVQKVSLLRGEGKLRGHQIKSVLLCQSHGKNTSIQRREVFFFLIKKKNKEK